MFDIFQFGDLSNGCLSAGSHFNPDNAAHGGNDASVRHVGDLGNIVADRKFKLNQRFCPKSKSFC